MEWYWWLLIGLGAAGALVLGPLLCGRLFFPELTLALFRRFSWTLAGFLHKIKPELDLRLLTRAGNRYFKKAFAATPYGQRLLLLPFCLRPRDCPAKLDPEIGLLCPGDCQGCELGKIKSEAQALGYGAIYVVPSSRLTKLKGLPPSDQFIKAKVRQHSPGAVLGVTCPWYLRHRLLDKHRVGRGGYAYSSEPHNGTKQKSAVQGVLMDSRNCRSGTVNWQRVRQSLYLSEKKA